VNSSSLSFTAIVAIDFAPDNSHGFRPIQREPNLMPFHVVNFYGHKPIAGMQIDGCALF